MSKKKTLEMRNDEDVIIAQPVDVMNLPTYPWATPFNFDPLQDRKSNNGMPSLTTPDMSMSMDEILRRYKQGLSLTQHPSMYGGYELDEELPDLRKMDLAEIQEMREQNDEVLRQIREEMVTKEKQKKQLLESQAKEAWFNQELDRRKKIEEKKSLKQNDASEE